MNDNILNNNEWKKSDYGNPLNTATNSFFKTHDEHDIEEGNELKQMKRKEDNKNDEQPNKRTNPYLDTFYRVSNTAYPVFMDTVYWSTLIMEYLVKISKKARILELKRRHLKITVLTSNTPYPSRKIRRICACTSQKTTKETRSYTPFLSIGYVEQLERLEYVLPQDLSVGLILNGLTSDFAGFVKNYNMHNMGKTIGELHALLIEYEKGLPKKAATPQVMAIQGGRIQKDNKKSLNAKGKGKRKGNEKDKSYIPKPKTLNLLLKSTRQRMMPATTAKRWGILTPPYTPQHNGVFEKRNRTLLDMVRSMMNLTTLPLSFWDYALETATCILNMVPTKKVDKTPYELWYGQVPNLSYLKEMMAYYFYFPPENKIVVARYVELLEKNLLSQEVSGRAEELEEIQDEDTLPFENTSEIL
ncbi:retrotransposon protein, putative, ty1-copia subclass [Tanacetum coccineum]